METDLDNIEFEAGGLNHLSILLSAKYKDSGKDGYPSLIKTLIIIILIWLMIMKGFFQMLVLREVYFLNYLKDMVTSNYNR